MFRIVCLVTAGGVLLLAAACGVPSKSIHTVNTSSDTLHTNSAPAAQPVTAEPTVPSTPISEKSTPTVVLPVAGFYGRVTKKTFGMYITPKTSPVQPERFTGYHAGADAETTPSEQSIDVPVFSIAAGTVTLARYVSGYGGVVMIRYAINGKSVTALYGHVRLASVRVKVGDSVHAGQQIAVLGTGYSAETDGERKHLHFAILVGASSIVKGYVSAKSQLSAWLDPVTWLHEQGATEPVP